MANRRYVKQCACGEEFLTKDSGRSECFTCKPPRQRAIHVPLGGAKSKIRCGQCAFGKPCPEAWSGYQCLAELAWECVPGVYNR